MPDIVIASDLFFGFLALTCAIVGYFVRSEIRYLDLSRDIKETKACIRRIENQLGATAERVILAEDKVAELDKDLSIVDDRYKRERPPRADVNH
jgi:hypothetical protein